MKLVKFTPHLCLSSLLLCFVVTGCKKKKQPQPTQQSSTQPASSTKTRTKSSKSQVLARKVLIKKAKTITLSAFKTLSGRLKKAIKKGGIPEAISTCTTVAQPTTKQVGKKFKVTLARVSHKPRNAKNAASPAEQAIIATYIKQASQGKTLKPMIVKSKTGAQTFYAPIVLALPLCLKCHGSVGKQIKAKHYALIKSSFPQDKATNFKMGDIRGLWKVTFP